MRPYSCNLRQKEGHIRYIPNLDGNARGESKALRRRAIDFSRVVCIAVSCSIKIAQFIDSRLGLSAQYQRISARVAALTSFAYGVRIIDVAT